MLMIRFSPEIIMELLRTGKAFQSEDGTRLHTVIQGIPQLPLVGIGLGSSQAVLPFSPVPNCVYELCLDDGRPEDRNIEVQVHCAQGQGFPHDFESYAEQAYLAHHAALTAARPVPFRELPGGLQRAWHDVAVRVARLTTHILAEQAGDRERKESTG